MVTVSRHPVIERYNYTDRNEVTSSLLVSLDIAGIIIIVRLEYVYMSIYCNVLYCI